MTSLVLEAAQQPEPRTYDPGLVVVVERLI